jgi:ketosteroid isomerase-like protein
MALPMQTPHDFASEWKNNLDAGNVDGIMQLYDENVVVVAEIGKRVHGTKELRPVVESFVAMAPYTFEFTLDMVVEGETHALIAGPWTFDGTGPDGPVNIDARATIVLEKRADGYYTILDDFFSQG